MSSAASREQLTLAVAAAMLAACATALLSGFIYAAQFGPTLDNLTNKSFYQFAIFVGLNALLVTALACPVLFMIIGLPLYRLSLRQGWVHARHYAVVGFGVSCLVGVGTFWTFSADRWFAALLTVGGGTVATLAFWYVARPGHGSNVSTN